MVKQITFVCLLALGILGTSMQATACAAHLYFDTQNMGFLGRTAVRLAGLAPPERVFKIKHPVTTLATIGETVEIPVSYRRPFFAKAVRMELSGSNNIVLVEDTLQLEERRGDVRIRFQLTAPGYNTINVKVVGEHSGEMVREYSRIYVRSQEEATAKDLQVSAR